MFIIPLSTLAVVHCGPILLHKRHKITATIVVINDYTTEASYVASAKSVLFKVLL